MVKSNMKPVTAKQKQKKCGVQGYRNLRGKKLKPIELLQPWQRKKQYHSKELAREAAILQLIGKCYRKQHQMGKMEATVENLCSIGSNSNRRKHGRSNQLPQTQLQQNLLNQLNHKRFVISTNSKLFLLYVPVDRRHQKQPPLQRQRQLYQQRKNWLQQLQRQRGQHVKEMWCSSQTLQSHLLHNNTNNIKNVDIRMILYQSVSQSHIRQFHNKLQLSYRWIMVDQV